MKLTERELAFISSLCKSSFMYNDKLYQPPKFIYIGTGFFRNSESNYVLTIRKSNCTYVTKTAKTGFSLQQREQTLSVKNLSEDIRDMKLIHNKAKELKIPTWMDEVFLVLCTIDVTNLPKERTPVVVNIKGGGVE